MWTPFLYALGTALLHNWVPVGDMGVTALRSWDVLSAHPPLVGAPTRLAGGVYDLGPMQYWLLALPVHLSPAHGVWWGAALWCMLAGSLAIEAALAAAGVLGILIAAGTILGIVAWIPQIAAWYGPAWNPWFGIMFFIAALASGWAVLSGHRKWWPVLAITGSVAAQAHDMYVLSAVSVVGAGFVAVTVSSVKAREYRWAIGGVAAGLACWIAPLVQQVTSRTGNLTALASSLVHRGQGAGVDFGLKALSAATQPPASWWMPIRNLATIGNRTTWFGAMQLMIVGLTLLIAVFVLRSRQAAALSVLSLIISATALLTFSSVPAHILAISPLNYMMVLLFPVGFLAWLAVTTVIALAGWRALRELRSARRGPAGDANADAATAGPRSRRAGWLVAASLAVALTAAGCYGTTLVVSHMRPRPENGVMRAVSSGIRQIERTVPARRVAVTVVGSDVTFRRRVALGLAYALRSAGYTPLFPDTSFALRLGAAYEYRGGPATRVTVTARKNRAARQPVVVSLGSRHH